MNWGNISVCLSLALAFSQIGLKDASQSEPGEDNSNGTLEYDVSEKEDWDPYPNRPGCSDQCECRSEHMICVNTIPDIIPSSEEGVMLREIPWAELENQKHFCHSNWSNVKSLEIVFKREYNYIVRGVFLDNEFDCLKQLQSIKLKYAEITFSKSTFSDLKNLKILDLSESIFNISNLNDILAVPEILPKLSTLILRGSYRYTPHTQLNQSLIDSLSMRPVQYLDVSEQTLEFYFDNIRVLCKSLKTLIIVDSDLKVSSSGMDPCHSLDLVDISRSNLLKMSFRLPENSPNTIGCVNRSVPLANGLGFQLPRTVHANRMFSTPVYFTDDRFKILNCLIHLDHGCTEELEFTHNHLPKFEFLFAVQCLIFIDLSWNDIQTINPGTIKFSANLEKVDLRANEFGSVSSKDTNLGTLFHYNDKLSVIDLSKNDLATIPKDTFALNPKLRKINLSGNSFSQIHFKISHLLHLEILDLRHNKIKFLDAKSRYEVDELYRRQIESRRTLNDINTLQILLDGNPFLCECYLYEFNLWFDTAPFLETTKHNSYCVVNEKELPMNRSAVDAAIQDCQRHIFTPTYFQYLYISFSNFVKRNALELSTTAGILILISVGMCTHLYYTKTLNQRFFKTKPMRKGGESRRSSPGSALDVPEKGEEPSRPGSFLQLEDRRSLVTDYQRILYASKSVGKLSGFGYAGTCFRVGEKYIMTAWHVINGIILKGPGISSNPFEFLENDDVFVDFGFLSSTLTTEKRVGLKKNVVFENNDLDIAIVELRPLGGQTLPGPLTLHKNTLHVDQFTFVGHPGGEFKQLNPIDGFVEIASDQVDKAIEFSKRKARRNGFDGIYNPHRILFNSSFQKGASGSPGLVVWGNTAVVITVLLQGYPDWFYDPEVDKGIKDTVHNHNRIEQGVLMESLYSQLLLLHDKDPTFCDDIFRGNVGTPMDEG